MPAQNDAPSPRTTTTRTSSSLAASSAASSSSENIAAFIALRLSGRFSVIVATCSFTP